MTKLIIIMGLALALAACQPLTFEGEGNISVEGDPDTNTVTISYTGGAAGSGGIETIIADTGNMTDQTTVYVLGGDCVSTEISGNNITITNTCATNWVVSGSVEDTVYIALGWFNDESQSAAD